MGVIEIFYFEGVGKQYNSDEGARVLPGDGGGRAEGRGGVQRPVWVAQKLARQQHHIRLRGVNDGVGLMRLGDHPHRSRKDAGFAPDALGEGRLVCRANLDLGMRHDSSGRAIDQVDA